MSNTQLRIASSQSANSSSDQQGYIDLHTRGCGYLSRVRWAEPSRKSSRRAEQFLCCAISAIHGDKNDPTFTYFDLRVSGSEAQEIILQLKDAVDKKQKVFVAFKVGDIYPHVYERNVKDHKAGKVQGKEWAALIKGRLLQITHVKIDGKLVFTKVQGTGDKGESNEPENPESNERVNAELKTGTDD